MLDGIEVILGNTFLNAYHIDVLKGISKFKIIIRLVDKLVSLKVEYQTSLVKISIHLVSLQELQHTSLLIFMHVE
jgi:hypothetical protein